MGRSREWEFPQCLIGAGPGENRKPEPTLNSNADFYPGSAGSQALSKMPAAGEAADYSGLLRICTSRYGFIYVAQNEVANMLRECPGLVLVLHDILTLALNAAWWVRCA